MLKRIKPSWGLQPWESNPCPSLTLPTTTGPMRFLHDWKNKRIWTVMIVLSSHANLRRNQLTQTDRQTDRIVILLYHRQAWSGLRHCWFHCKVEVIKSLSEKEWSSGILVTVRYLRKPKEINKKKNDAGIWTMGIQPRSITKFDPYHWATEILVGLKKQTYMIIKDNPFISRRPINVGINWHRRTDRRTDL
jgi:hypothetical protein